MNSFFQKKSLIINFLVTVTLTYLVISLMFPTTEAEIPVGADGETPSAEIEYPVYAEGGKPVATVCFSKQSPASLKPVLTWTKVEGAVAYEIEFFHELPETAEGPYVHPVPFFSSREIYVNGFNADLTEFLQDNIFYWRVRGLDLDGKPVGEFSDAVKVYLDRNKDIRQKPVPTSIFNQSTGSTLLYPVYAWIPVNGADKYEVEILDAPPENPNGIMPSVHRIDSAIAVGFDYYDVTPRFAAKPFYWRVRGMDRDGRPVGVFSDAGEFILNPDEPVPVATFGDSITHGGGSVSYSPADWEFSYQHYLDFPTINLGKSGDTSQTMVERFDQDVLPFKPQILLIMAGSNSVRGSYTAQSIIDDLQVLEEKCLKNGIRPVFLTLPPINPDNINRVFNEETDPDWQEKLQQVNAFIRTREYIDIAQDMGDEQGILPTGMAIDGLHLDMKGKQAIAAVINANWQHILQSPTSVEVKG
ncbi:hypothetical protein P22_1755 [Propionispora sp. 2/2-37]|uniref:SGNH/GDSL hydrolase family protein n=1 Tax=Propionispora sp. 2/2-37 TaxID=1677858 RepID=UPI0006BB6D05|nr:GDSL-type esterase/lipase family protein [Propionispora sp. 2/2-37]CUH95678.1 hypothetical protein P22_1755 [Propionispora sp. 2/2-37]